MITFLQPSVKVGLPARAAAFLLATAVLTGACSSSDSDALTLDEYFAEFEAIDAEVDTQFEALWADIPEDEDPFADEANLEPFKDFVAGFPRIVGDAIDSANELNPPSEVEDAHNDLIDTGEALVVAFEEGAGVISEAETMAELETLEREVGPTIDAAEAAFDAACLTVVDIAIANDIDVDVTCVDE